MHPDFWHSRWEANQIGFHRPSVHEDLEAQCDALLGEPQRILVPLCGKTWDLPWLAQQGHDAVGIELSRKAVEALHAEHGIEATIDTLGPFERWSSDKLTVLVGNIFDATPELLGPFDGVWDRAALVALKPDQRGPYTQVIDALLRPGGWLLQNHFAYDQSKMDGPPHSVPEDEVHAHYPAYTEDIIRSETVEAEGKFKERGLESWSIYCRLMRKPQ